VHDNPIQDKEFKTHLTVLIYSTVVMEVKIGSALIVGGGIGGIQAALDLAESGIKIYLVESKPCIGGAMAQLDKTFPTNDCAMCILAPKLVECGRHPNVELITFSQITEVKGTTGDFKVKVKKLQRYVDPSKCTGCGECEQCCPVETKSEFDEGLSKRKAIYRLYPQAIPNIYTIEKSIEKSPCKIACPVETNVQGYIQLTVAQKFKEALALIKERNPFPAICGRVCHHPCETECLRGKIDEPINIRGIKRFLTDLGFQDRSFGVEDNLSPKANSFSHLILKDEFSSSLQCDESFSNSAKLEKVAIIGSGPAGLTGAYDLLKSGYSVTIFERMPVMGGMMRLGIPDYRLPKDILQYEIDTITRKGVEVRLNTEIGKDISFLDLEKQEFKAILIATGCHSNQCLDIPGESLKGVIPGTAFLRVLNLGKKVNLGRKVAVIGGGNVAIDSARSAIRLGSKEVFILYRRGKEEMPCYPWEMADALEEGIRFEFLVAPLKILGEGNQVKGIECIRTELGEPDQSGRRRPMPIQGSEFVIDVDTIIPAIGQFADLSYISSVNSIKVTKRGTIEIDPTTLQTGRANIFAAGDVVLGPATVIEAIAQGHIAAESIKRYLRNEDLRKDHEKKTYLKVSKLREEVEKKKRTKMSQLSVSSRITNFGEIEMGFTCEEAIAEAKRCLSCSTCSECMLCLEVCKPRAINHQMAEEIVEINVGSIILAPGFEKFDATPLSHYNYKHYKNVISSIEFERILNASGPFQGKLSRPSDKKEPKRIAFIQCVGSRDTTRKSPYCSSVCCAQAIKEAIIAKEHTKNALECSIFYIDLRTFGKGFESYYNRAKNDYGIKFIRAMVSEVHEIPENQNLIVKYENEEGELKREEFDLLILSVGLKPVENLKRLAEICQVALNDFGFVKTMPFSSVKTDQPGIFVCGTASSPKDIPETVVEASAAAGETIELLSSVKNTLVKKKDYPKEIDMVWQKPRIGVFICHCGINIAGIIDVQEIVEYARTLSNVVHAETNLYSCSDDTQRKIKEVIEKYNLNRIVVAACTPRTHEPLFQETMREKGLNKHLFELVNIREQCSWVHAREPKEATEKAKDLLRMACARALFLEPLPSFSLPVIPKALIIGGGISGMNAALTLANQGYETFLIEREESLGGNARILTYTIEGELVQDYLKELIIKVVGHPKIRVYTKSEVTEVTGYIGNFKTKIQTDHRINQIEHGVIVVATGAKEYVPTEYQYGRDKRVITQRELEKLLSDSQTVRLSDYQTIAMIQCIGSRNEERRYCSRVCCSQAVKNALLIKEKNPQTEIFILYKDVRTYGFKEIYYQNAREKGVLFIRYEEAKPPEIINENKQIFLKIKEPILDEEVILNPDLVVLSTGIVPESKNKEIAQLLKIPLNEDGFFLEAHMKLRPVDFTCDGIFVCGLAHYPKNISEAIAQAKAAATRASIILSRNQIEVEGKISYIKKDRCNGCGICVAVCPYQAIELDVEQKMAVVKEALCKGCGTCAASCLTSAVELKGFSDEQIIAMLEVING